MSFSPPLTIPPLLFTWLRLPAISAGDPAVLAAAVADPRLVFAGFIVTSAMILSGLSGRRKWA